MVYCPHIKEKRAVEKRKRAVLPSHQRKEGSREEKNDLLPSTIKNNKKEQTFDLLCTFFYQYGTIIRNIKQIT